MKKILSLIILLSFATTFSQNGSSNCEGAEPSCSDENGVKIFPNVTGSPDGGTIGCLGQTPNQAWFFIKIDQTGSLEFDIIQNSSFDVDGNPNGTDLDVDFIAWGPFRSADGNCTGLEYNAGIGQSNTSESGVLNNYYIDNQDMSNVIDCSYSSRFIETFRIPNANAGDYYVLLVTNFSNSEGFIKLEQTNFGEAGAGVTDCTIVVGELGLDQEVCVGTDVELDATPTAGNVDTYEWQLDTGGGYTTLAGEISATLDITNNVSGIYKAIVTDTDGNIGQDEIEITFFDVPTATTPDNVEICDADGDGFHAFDFDTDVTPQILNGQSAADFEVFYFTSLLAAEANVAGTNISGSSYTNATAFTLETIFARIQNAGVAACGDIVDFTIQVFDEPTANDPGSIVICDDNGDGFHTFNFDTDTTPTILNGQSDTDFEILYFSSLVAAQDNIAGTNLNGTSYTNTTAFTIESIFARVQNNANTTCSNIIEFTIDVIDEPVANTPTNIETCDTDRDGFHIFDFDTDITPQVLGTQSDTDFEVLYFTSLTAAEANVAGTNINGSSYTNAASFTLETIYARIQNNSITTCNQIIDFTIQVFDEPTANDPGNIVVCDDNGDGFHTFNFDTDTTPTILNGQSDTDFEILYFSSLIAAQDNIAGTNLNGTSYTNTTAFTIESVFARVQNNANTTCFNIIEFTIDVIDVPVANTPTNIEICDIDRDGFHIFDFDTDITPQVLGTQSDTDFEVLYFTSLTAAEANVAGTNINGSSYTNAASFTLETIYARIQNNSITTCNQIIDFTIHVFDNPIANDPLDVAICDTDRDGFQVFNFDSDITPQVLAGQATSDFTVTYFSSLTAAQDNIAGTNLDGTSYTNTTAFGIESIFVRIQNNTNTSCNDIEEFTIQVFDNPVANTPMNVEVCDADRDGFYAFDFETDTTPIVLGTQSDTEFEVRYFTSLAAAQANVAGTNINGSSYTNATAFTIETIFARIQNSNNPTCGDIIDFTIQVFDTPVANDPLDIEICDADRDGFHIFNLDADITPQVLMGQAATDFSVSYFSSLIAAQNNVSGTNLNGTNYTNTTAFTLETIFVRIQNKANTTCSDIEEFTINIFDNPVANTPINIEICDTDRDGFHAFNLDATTTPQILNGQTASNFDVSYFTSFTAAQNNIAGTNISGSSYTNTTAFIQETIYARIQNNANTTCSDIVAFTINVNDVASPNQPSIYRLCDDVLSGSNSDLTTNSFLLNIKDSEILGLTNSNLDFTISYHTTSIGAQTSATSDVIDKTTPYAVTNSQSVFVRIENRNNPDCFVAADDSLGSTFTSFELKVDPLPTLTNPAEFIQCHNEIDLSTTVILTDTMPILSPSYMANGEVFEFYASESDANAGTSEITGSDLQTYPVTGTGEAWVRVFSDQGCYRIGKINITINFSADIPYDRTFIACDDFLDVNGNDNANNDDTDGIATFDFSEATDEIKAFFPVATRPNLTISYYESELDRASNSNEINSQIGNYRNNNDPAFANNQTIYAKIIDGNSTACFGTANIFLQVDTVPLANNLAQPLSFCDDFDSGSSDDGENINIDLRQTVNEILGTSQTETDFIVTYHTSQADASSGNAPILNDTNFRNSAPAGFVAGTVSRQTIFVRVEDRNKVPACFNDHLSFDIEITPLPELQNTIAAIEVCDVPTVSDSDPRNRVAQNIDATVRNVDILNGRDASIFSVRYYKSQTNALADVNRIAIANLLDYENDPANTTFPLNVNSDAPGIETLFFVIYSADTGCASEPFTLDIRVYPEPNIPVNINNYSDCDTDNNGLGNDTDGILENIAFSSKITEVLANYTTAEQSNFTVSFHVSLADAQSGNGALDTNSYINLSNNQTIFVRVLNNQTGCVYDDLSFEIIVNGLPSYDPLDLSQVACLNNLPLTLQVDNPLTGYDYSWVENQSGNEIGTAQSVDIRAGGTYTLTVTDRVTLCNRIEMFEVLESEAAVITSEHVAVIDETADIFGNNFSITIDDEPGILGIGDYEYALLDEMGNFVYTDTRTHLFLTNYRVVFIKS